MRSLRLRPNLLKMEPIAKLVPVRWPLLRDIISKEAAHWHLVGVLEDPAPGVAESVDAVTTD